MAGGCVEAQSRAHALLPCTVFFFDFFDLVQHGAQLFTGELTHLQIQQRGDDRNQRNHEDNYQPHELLINLHCKTFRFEVWSNSNFTHEKTNQHWDQKLDYRNDDDRSP